MKAMKQEQKCHAYNAMMEREEKEVQVGGREK